MLNNYIADLDTLLANQLITSWDVITGKDVIGWDIGRAAYLVRVGVEVNYLKDRRRHGTTSRERIKEPLAHSTHGRSSDVPISSAVVSGLIHQRFETS